MVLFTHKSPALLLALSGVLLSGSACAAETWTWNFESGSGDCVSDCSSGDPGSLSKTFQDTGSLGTLVNVVATAWSNTGGANTSLADGLVTRWSGGLGVNNDDEMVPEDGEASGSPNHSTDNSARYDLVMFDFGTTPVALTEISLGWVSNDADISLLAYDGVGAPTLGGVAYSASTEGLTGSGWSLVGNYDVDAIDGSAPHTAAINAGGESAIYWIVAAYNNRFGACNAGAGVCQDASYPDHFKIGSLSAMGLTPPDGNGVPLPGPWSLMLLGGALVAGRRRRAP